jgi:glycosyltransferase involved in cell wall biosynthesis
MRLNKKTIIKDYNYLKLKANKLSTQGKYNQSLSYIKAASKIANHLNFRYADDDLEELLNLISAKLLQPERRIFDKDTFVFYDSFGLDNRGLTQQYIRALISWNKQFIYILDNDGQLDSSNNILEELKNYSRCTIEIIPTSYSDTEKIKHIAEIIHVYKPSKAFLHFAPYNVVGVCVFNVFPTIKRYLINLTDHAFWLGKSCADYFIEFREYGYNISVKHRGIPEDKIRIQNYYPIQQKNKFEDFPIDVSNKVVLFSGGAYYKIYGEKMKFLYLIKRVLSENKNAILLIAGWGNDSPLKQFIVENDLENQIVLLGSRKDINEVFKNSDLYLATYPFSGGLMAQFAAVHNTNIMAYSKKDLPFNFIEGLLKLPKEVKLTFSNEEDYHDEANKLIQNKEYRHRKSEDLNNSILTELQFNQQLNKLIYSTRVKHQLNHDCDIEVDRVFNLYLETENNFIRNYYIFIFTSIRMNIFSNFKIAFRFVFDLLFYRNDLILNKMPSKK